MNRYHSLSSYFLKLCYFHWNTIWHVFTHMNKWPASQTPNVRLSALKSSREDCHHSVWWGCGGCRPLWRTAAVYLDTFPTPISPATQEGHPHFASAHSSPSLRYTLTFHTVQKVITGKEVKKSTAMLVALWDCNTHNKESQTNLTRWPLITGLTPVSREQLKRSDFPLSNCFVKIVSEARTAKSIQYFTQFQPSAHTDTEPYLHRQVAN